MSFISYCVQEEEMLNQERTEGGHLASTFRNKFKKRKNKEAISDSAQNKQ